MRLSVILVIVCAVLFTVFMALGGNHGKAASGDALAQPLVLPGWMSGLGSVTSPFAPRLTLAGSPFKLTPSRPIQLPIPPSTDHGRVARFTLVSGQAALVTYDCQQAECQDRRQTLCLVGRGDPTPSNCPRTPAPAASGSVLVLDAGGVLTLESGGGPAVIESD